MVDRVVFDSRHKFVYYDFESIDWLRELSNEYVARIGSTEPIVIHISCSFLFFDKPTAVSEHGHNIVILARFYLR